MIVYMFASSVGYMQLLFNVINVGVLGNLSDRRAGMLYAVFCSASYFGTKAHFNFQPRFFLVVLLFFAGAGFIAENLYASRKYLSELEWIQIFIILGVFVITKQSKDLVQLHM